RLPPPYPPPWWGRRRIPLPRYGGGLGWGKRAMALSLLDKNPPASNQTEAPEQNALLGVQAVLRLVPHRRLRAVDHAGRHPLAAVGGQAVHEDGAGLGGGHQAVIDLERAQHVVA